MNSATEIAKKAQKFTIDNSPLLLTVVGAIGIAGTAYLSGRAGFKAAQILQDKQEHYAIHRQANEPIRHEFTLKEKLALTWKAYVPACGVGLVTLGAVVGSNHISTSRSAALASAFAISQEAAEKYKAKVIEKLGETKEKAVVDGVVQDRVNSNPPTEANTIVVSNGAGRQLLQDSWSGRYFELEVESVHQAVNELNRQVNMHGYATLTDFYDLLGLPKIKESDELGWNSDQLLEIYLAAAMHDNGKQPVLAIEYRVVPSRDYFRTR